MEALRQVEGWPCAHVAVAVAGRVEASHGDAERVFPWTSVTKLAHPNAGFEAVADLVAERAEMSFAGYFEAVWGFALAGSAAHGAEGSLEQLLTVARELLEPVRISRETLDEAVAVQFPGLAGVMPGFGRAEPNDWGLGLELRGAKSPHWTGTHNSSRTFGHFGRSGAFVWVDPDAGLALACVTDLDFGDWAKEAWPRLSDAVLA